jgi:hypothetical protein
MDRPLSGPSYDARHSSSRTGSGAEESLAADPQIGKIPVAAGLLVLRDQEIPLVAALPTE